MPLLLFAIWPGWMGREEQRRPLRPGGFVQDGKNKLLNGHLGLTKLAGGSSLPRPPAGGANQNGNGFAGPVQGGLR